MCNQTSVLSLKHSVIWMQTTMSPQRQVKKCKELMEEAEGAAALVQEFTALDPVKRPSFGSMVQHAFLRTDLASIN